MKNYYRTVIISGIIYFALVLSFVLFTGEYRGTSAERESDIILLNDITYDASESWGDLSTLDETDYGVDFVILDPVEKVIYSSVKDDDTTVTITVEQAIKKGYPYKYIFKNDQMKGTVILLDDGQGGLLDLRLRLVIGLSAVGIIFIIIACIIGARIKKRIYDPFRDMESFAGRVAEGDLDVPLHMDRDNMFGAFTESFDIMRDELRESRKREIEAQRRERELVASLSHDLKTPITGIKLTCEVLQAKLSKYINDELAANDINTREHVSDKSGTDGDKADCIAYMEQLSSEIGPKLDNIYAKAEQIELLINDLLSSTLEDLGEFKVAPEDVSAEVLADIVSRYDDRGLTVISDIPEAIIYIDQRRISQVIGNIISNSYKYAGTRIDVGFRLVEGFMEMSLTDYGPGVPQEELALITNKFYRGKQWVESGE
ncbi:MAG: HAMP domain-containing histidine kinase, partial [Eubacterium sp.]|nr:HAMP domain-containing histidine kinase [Eubacterium sp.]